MESMDTTRRKKRGGACAVALATLTAITGSSVVTLVGARPAEAAAGDVSYVLDHTNVRVCGSVRQIQCPDGAGANGVMGSVVGNQWDRTWCWRDGEWAGEPSTNRWFKVTADTTAGSKTGWVSAAQVPIQAFVPWCSSWK
ncbi:hypothetical protein O7602_13180 [Micromonospora sp. WMMD1128]|uniref:hypothetical protein n=1 Tax=Micromonospora sp. WMMD1128 TaxID=3015150 RepID=UPI00248A9834|nr:hypothetical protein [Micromonospora sp. WMMD1128]WBB76421.1 hypothetical protein O7602_13180 [Micromonospora sp. WMMD1128]